jgi:hypothetical protein
MIDCVTQVDREPVLGGGVSIETITVLIVVPILPLLSILVYSIL